MQHSYIILKARTLELIEKSESKSLRISRSNFSKLLDGFLKEVKDKEFIILLADGLVYKKEILALDPKKTQDEYDQFISQTSCSPEKIKSLRVYEKDNLLVLAANSETYLTIKGLIEKKGGRVEYVFPKSMIKEISGADKLKYCDLDGLEKKLEEYKKINFLDSPKVSPINLKINIPKVNKYNFKGVLIIGGVLILIILFGLNLTGESLFKKKVEPPSFNITTTPSPLPIPALNISSASLTKESITIKVLNGSGIAGQAGRVKNQLIKIDFLQIEIGNAEKKETGNSVVYFKEGVPADLAKEILDQIKTVVKNVVEEATKSGEVDVLVVTKR